MITNVEIALELLSSNSSARVCRDCALCFIKDNAGLIDNISFQVYEVLVSKKENCMILTPVTTDEARKSNGYLVSLLSYRQDEINRAKTIFADTSINAVIIGYPAEFLYIRKLNQWYKVCIKS